MLLKEFNIRVWITAAFLLSPLLFYAQDWTLNIDGAVVSENDRSKMEGVKVVIFRNGAKSDQITTDSKGKFAISLNPDAKYLIEFQYPGYVTKKISFSTKFVPPADAEGGMNPFRFDMYMFKEIPGLDVSILNKPVAEVVYDPQILDFTYDKEYTKSIKSQVDKLKADMEAALAAEAAAAKENEKKYQDAMSDASKSESRGDYNQAISYYEAALAIKPGDGSASSKKEAAQKKYDKEMAEKNKEKAYTEAIEKAELAVYAKEYKNAEVEFQKALDVKPGDTYARDQLKEIRDIMVNAAKSEQIYFAAISKGDQAMQSKDYITAKAEYIKAKDAKPDEEYPKIQLEQVEALLVADAKREVDYVNAIERGETGLESGDYEAAKAAFEQAGEIKPTEKYPKEQLTKIAAILSEITLKNNNYAAAIKKADDALTKNDFENAKKGYETALGIKPNEKYPKDQIAAIVAKLDEIAKKDQKYAELIKEADLRFDSKDMIAAKAEYNKALEVKPGEKHPMERIAQISGILEAEAKLENEYKQAIENADNAFNAKDYNSAKFEYQNASNLKPNEAYPKEKMLTIDGLLADLAKKDEAYDKAVKAGDDAFAAANFEAAKTEYTAALAIKPKEAYPQDQLEKVKAKIIELANLSKEYDAVIASADKLMAANKLEEAKKDYEKALELKPSEAYPKEKIASIAGLMADAQKKDEEYQKFIEEGDKNFASKKYAESKSAFTSASGIKPNEKYPKDKLLEIDKLIAEMEQLAASYDAAIKKADEAFNAGKLEAALPLYKEAAGIKEGESYPIQQITLIESKLDEQKKLEENYTTAIAKAEASEKAKDFDVALATFKEASLLKPNESYPKEKIASLTTLIAENEKKNAAYDDAISLADQALKGAEYDIALTQYKNASQLKPEESYPKEKIKETEALKAGALAAIELANKQQAEYDALIKEGDALLKSAEYASSKAKFQAALGIKPTESYPKTKIGEIDNLMANEAEKAARNEKYKSLIVDADRSFKSEDWETAKSTYLEAQSVKPEETYPASQLKAIDAAIAAALALASQQEQEAAAKAKEEKYTKLIATADASFKTKDWETAKSTYREAQSVKPEETYPAAQLKAIDEAIAAELALASQQEKEAAERAKEEKYNGLIASGDAAFKSKDWDAAKSAYKEAQGVKPGEAYPGNQLKAIDAAVAAELALASQQEKEAAARAKEERYNGLIASADKAFNAKDWETAKSDYKEAQSVKPSEPYPGNQLKAIDAAVAAAQALASQQEKEAAAREKEAKYNGLIGSADQALEEKDWETAKSDYIAVQGVKPAETYPGTQLKAIDEAIAAEAALASQQEKEAAMRAKEENYSRLIASADKAFRLKDWQTARKDYTEAQGVKPDENYPGIQLKAIEAEIASQGEQAKREEYEAYISSADRAFKSKDWPSARTNYESALSVLPAESYPKDQLQRIAETLQNQEAIALKTERDEKYRQMIGDA
ncbi:MAG TPA: hypothetical protein DCX54_07625, partial [Flavobacteriales bacterium]|nr:hypothetical protein [Flavobacteriales bacterium]